MQTVQSSLAEVRKELKERKHLHPLMNKDELKRLRDAENELKARVKVAEEERTQEQVGVKKRIFQILKHPDVCLWESYL